MNSSLFATGSASRTRRWSEMLFGPCRVSVTFTIWSYLKLFFKVRWDLILSRTPQIHWCIWL